MFYKLFEYLSSLNSESFYFSPLHKEFGIVELCKGHFYMIFFLVQKFGATNSQGSLVKIYNFQYIYIYVCVCVYMWRTKCNIIWRMLNIYDRAII